MRIISIEQSLRRRTWPRINRRSEQSTMESQTVGLTAGLEQQSNQSTCESQHSMSRGHPVFQSKSGQQDGRDFNDRGGERERQPISFRSCVGDSENTDQKAVQVVSALSGSLDNV